MLPLRYPWIWAGFGWVLVIGVIVGSLIPGPSVPDLHLSDKALHVGAYFSMMVWFAGLYSRNVHPIIAVVLLVLGVGLDLLQATTRTRSLEIADIAADAAGILVGLALAYWLLEGWCQRLERRWAALRA